MFASYLEVNVVISFQAEQVRQMIMAGMVDHVARKLSKEELKQAHLSFHKAAYRTADMGDIIFLHSSSVLHKLKPEWIVFQEVFKLGEKFYARGNVFFSGIFVE